MVTGETHTDVILIAYEVRRQIITTVFHIRNWFLEKQFLFFRGTHSQDTSHGPMSDPVEQTG